MGVRSAASACVVGLAMATGPLSAWSAEGDGTSEAAAVASIRELDADAMVALAWGGPAVAVQDALADAARAREALARVTPLDGLVIGVGTDASAVGLRLQPQLYLSVDAGSLVAWPSRVRAARDDRAAQQARLALERDLVEADVRALVEAIGLSEARVTQRLRAQLALEESSFVLRRAFSDGAATFAEVADLEQRVSAAVEGTAEAEAELRTLRARLEILIGRPLEQAPRARP